MISRRVEPGFKHLFPVAVLIAFLLCSGSALLAQDDAGQVIDKYLSAIGGADTLKGVKSMVSKGTFSMPMMGMDASLEVYVAPPGKSRMTVDMGSFGSASSGVNGDVAWDDNPMMGQRILKGNERADALRRAQVDQFINWQEQFSSAKVAGEQAVAGEDCVIVEFTPVEGSPIKGFFSKASGLMLKMEAQANTSTVVMEFSDFRDVSGMKMPFKTSMSTPEMGFDMIFDSIEVNVDIPDATFDLPAGIKRMLEASN